MIGLAALWLIGLGAASFALGGRTRTAIAERAGASLQGTATIADARLALVRGFVEMERLAIRRDDTVGHLAIDIDHLGCDLPPLGWALVDGDCRTLALSGLRLELSTAALFQLKRPKRAPFHVGEVIVDSADLSMSPSALVPGLGKVAIHIARASAGETTFKTPLSFLFHLRSLDATIAMPGDVSIGVRYEHGTLQLSGGMFGAAPIQLPVELPVAELADDAAAETAKLLAFGRDIAERVIAQRAVDWLKDKLRR